MGGHKLNPDTVTRKCESCHDVKWLKTDFYSHKGMPLGKAYTCKDCSKAKRTRETMKARGVEALEREIKREEILLGIKKRVLNGLLSEKGFHDYDIGEV